jgi:hypothetical protein
MQNKTPGGYSPNYSASLLRYYGSFTLAKFVIKTVGNNDTQQYLPWPPWAARQRWDHFYLRRKVGKVQKSTEVTFACHCRQRYRANFGQSKYGFNLSWGFLIIKVQNVFKSLQFGS